ncbi:MAG TPA: hypothetical protein VI322_03225 [Candidatus Saccharimonadia bacterium]
MNDKVTGWVGWVMFGALFMIFEGIMNVIYGLAAVLNAHWFVYTNNASYLLDISSWGWWLILLGSVLILSGSLLLSGNMFGRVMGIIFATISLLVNLAIFSTAPVWATLAIVLDAIVIYAIASHGDEMRAVAHQ